MPSAWQPPASLNDTDLMVEQPSFPKCVKKKKYFWVFTLVNNHISRLKESVPAADLWWPIYLLLCGEISRHNGKKVSEHPSQAPEREKEGEEKTHNEYLEILQFFKHECQFNTDHLLIKPTGFMLRNITVLGNPTCFVYSSWIQWTVVHRLTKTDINRL